MVCITCCTIKCTDNSVVETGKTVFETVDVTTQYKPTIDDIAFKVVAKPRKDYIHEVGPKSIGGHNWKRNLDYRKIWEEWGGCDLIPASPCVFFAWMGICKKVFNKDQTYQIQDYSLGQLLGVVDYDLDLGDLFKDAVERIARMAIEPSTRNYAWTGLLTMDQQSYNRKIMYKCKLNLGTLHCIPEAFLRCLAFGL